MPRKKKKVKSKSTSPSRAPSVGNSSMEFARQIMHLFVGLGCAAVLVYTSLDAFQNFVLGLLLVGMVLSLVAKTMKITILNRVLKLVERPHKGMPGQGAFFFLIGIGIPAFLFSSTLVVLAGIIALTFQDAFSTLIGTRFGKTKLVGHKTLEGSVGGFVPCFLALLIFLSPVHAFAVALAATIVELLPIEDAVSIPVAASYLVFVLI